MSADRSTAHLWALYFEDLKRRRRTPKTIQTKRTILWMFWQFSEPKPPLRATPADLERFLNRPSQGRGRQGGSVLSGNTRSSYGRAICAFYKWAAAEDLTARDRMAKFVPERISDPIPRALRRDELADLFSFLDLVEDSRIEVAIWLGYGAGLRVGEIAKLRIEHVHLRDNPAWLFAHGKGGRNRKVELAPLVVEVLRAWIYRPGCPRSGPLLANLRHPTRGIGARHVSELLAATMHAAGLEDTGHSLRHTFATELLRAGQGTNLRAVSRLLGHVNTNITERFYVGSYRADSEAAVLLLPDPRRRAR